MWLYRRTPTREVVCHGKGASNLSGVQEKANSKGKLAAKDVRG